VTSPELARFKRQGRPLVYGHRGARARAVENTIAAFDLALAEGADGVELDVRMTGDGELVILHDAHLALGEAKAARVDRLSWGQTKELGRKLGVSIPTLDEALAWHRRNGKLTNVELKGDVAHVPWLGRRAAELIGKHGPDGILVSSFHPGLVFSVHRQLPELPVALLLEAGRLNDLEQLAGYSRLLGAKAVHPDRRLVTADVMKRLRARGSIVNTWTVNDETEALRLSALGVDGIVTDRPLEILKALEGGA